MRESAQHGRWSVGAKSRCQGRLDGGRERRTAGGELSGLSCLNVTVETQFNEFKWNHIRRNEDGRRLPGLTRRAHPGTQHSAMRRFLMMRMLGFMGERLRGSEPADDQETQNKQAGEETL